MTREILKIDLTRDVISANERMAALAYRPAKDPHLTKLDHVAWWMVAILFVGWVIGNL
jgi:hypothetical protein